MKVAGQWLNGKIGLVYNRLRYYSAVASMYLTPDPIGLAGKYKSLKKFNNKCK
ncbi:hypothetical protein HZS38_13505 [Xenorhabdus nematophila]|uniref:RHS repeat-associated core domain-containing protein n=1 Tax=Xenorhabdus nematophila TaxID=628 RepID=UPI0002D408E0|nr:hypothetical protein D3790_13760 [Xenorhabdus nematophila]MBA0020115.1 hypothetical protein [Xenorhabdus nematophila]MCB4423771.1 hypothetical protein [Xenorhabdus nematophila]QNJ35766.1 hypothetical protein H8F46_13490 [Xenorhabdus nematophila]